VSSIYVQINGHIGLGPTLLSSMRSDAFSQLHQEGMIAGGHASILGVLFFARVWHARHYGVNYSELTRRAVRAKLANTPFRVKTLNFGIGRELVAGHGNVT
jgi:hypothetical protein